jgi:hypothetical protein
MCELTIGDIGVASDPSAVSSAPVDVVWSVVKHVLEGGGSPNHVAACGVFHPLWLPCGPTRVQLHHTQIFSPSLQCGMSPDDEAVRVLHKKGCARSTGSI